jgi:hypothetical protein
MLKIEGFEHLKGMHGNSSYFESCQFEAAGHAWKIRCYPNGFRASDAGYISLFLMREDDDENKEEESAGGGGVHAEFRFALVYPRSRLLPWPQHAMTTAYTFQNNSIYGWGFPRFMSVKGLERSGFLKGDCFAVRCDITVVDKSAVKDELVKAADMARMGMLCKCKDDLCKRHHRA